MRLWQAANLSYFELLNSQLTDSIRVKITVRRLVSRQFQANGLPFELAVLMLFFGRQPGPQPELQQVLLDALQVPNAINIIGRLTHSH